MNMPPIGSVVWMRTASRSARATVLCVTDGHVHLRFDDPAFNCDGRHELWPAEPFRILRVAAFFSALQGVQKEPKS